MKPVILLTGKNGQVGGERLRLLPKWGEVVAFARERLAEHGDAEKAAVEAGVGRIRPVLMTALAMIVGMIPMSLSNTTNAPLGRAVIGGLIVATVTTRLAIDELRSARVRREQYVGEWLPEPIITDRRDDPLEQVEMADSLSMAMLVLLESLSPEQRAALLLHDVFDYDTAQIAAIIGKTPENVRQLAARARRHVERGRPRFGTSREQREELARRFFAAAQEGDLAGLEALLAHDVQLTGDGGGQVPALARALRGRDRVGRTLRNWFRAGARVPGLQLRTTEINGSPGAIALDADGRVVGVNTFILTQSGGGQGIGFAIPGNLGRSDPNDAA